MKTEYNIKDEVWFHNGEPKLVKGRVVEIITLDHLNEKHDPGRELYVIEVKTGIDDVYEVRDFDQISPDSKGPINAYRKIKPHEAKRYLGKVGILLPNITVEHVEDTDEDGPSDEQIHAALAKAEAGPTTIFQPPAPKKTTKRRSFVKRKKNDA